jgi:hypothetical protein
MYYNKTMSETDFELNPNGVDTVCCDGCTCGQAHSATPRPE